MDSEEKQGDLDLKDQPPAESPSGGALVLSTEVGEYRAFSGASEGAVTEDQAAALKRPFQDDEYDIKPTGELFVSQVHVRRRLNEVYRPGGWALVPMSPVKQKPSSGGRFPKIMFFQEWHLVGNGRFLAAAWGEQEYQPNNANTTEATALEGVKSNALVRCAKDLGIASECWDKRWCERWKGANAEYVRTTKVSDDGKGQVKWFWRRKDAKPFTYPWAEKKEG